MKNAVNVSLTIICKDKERHEIAREIIEKASKKYEIYFAHYNKVKVFKK